MPPEVGVQAGHRSPAIEVSGEPSERPRAPLVRTCGRPSRGCLPPLLVHEGHRAGGRLPGRRARARLRAAVCSTWAVGRAATFVRSRSARSRSSAIDLSWRFVSLASRSPGGAYVQADARRLPVAPDSFDVAISLCQGGFGLLGGPGSGVDEDLLAAARDGRRGAAWRAHRAVGVLLLLPGAPPRRPVAVRRGRWRAARAHRGTRRGRPRPRPVELWTTCFTPRELRLMVAAAGASVDGLWSVEPGRYGRDVSWPRPRRVPGDRYEARWYPLRALSDSAARVRVPVPHRRNPPFPLQPTQARPESESVSDQQTRRPVRPRSRRRTPLPQQPLGGAVPRAPSPTRSSDARRAGAPGTSRSR